jgi:hypothetical protein
LARNTFNLSSSTTCLFAALLAAEVEDSVEVEEEEAVFLEEV